MTSERKLWYTVQPREGGRAPSCDYLTPLPVEQQRENQGGNKIGELLEVICFDCH